MAMNERERELLERTEKSAVVQKTQHHGKLVILGLLVILVPFAVLSKSLGHVHKTVSGVLKTISPEIELIEQTGGVILIFLGIVLACWGLGWLMTRTERGRRWLDWEKAKLFKRSPAWQKHAKHRKVVSDAERKTKVSAQAQPVLARAGGDWQPGIALRESGGMTTVFIPDVPSLATGRLYFLPKDQLVALDTSLGDFRSIMTGGGHGTGAWLDALAAARAS